MQTKAIDNFAERSILRLTPTPFCLPVDFQPNPNLSGMAMKKGVPEVFKVKPPEDFVSLLEAFSFCEVIPCPKNEPSEN